MSPNKFDTKEAIEAATPYTDQLREMYAFEQALGSAEAHYHYPLPEGAADALTAAFLVTTTDAGLVRLTWQGRKVVRDHL